MAKGQKRSGREPKKAKKEKPKPAASPLGARHSTAPTALMPVGKK